MKTSGQVVRLALEGGRYKCPATPEDLSEGKIEFWEDFIRAHSE